MATTPLDEIRALAGQYPEAEHTTILGDHEVYRVREKVFLWLGDGQQPGSVYVSVKLKDSQALALNLPFVTPSGYGMAKWGWINAEWPRAKVPIPLVAEWIAESYRHTAPKRLVASLDRPATVPDAPAPQNRRKSTASKRKRG